MKTSIQSPGFTPRQELTKFVVNKINKLTGLYQEIIGSEVCLKIESSATGQNKICSIRLFIPGNDLLASGKGRQFEAAVVKVMESLKKQIKKHKTKIIERRYRFSEVAN